MALKNSYINTHIEGIPTPDLKDNLWSVWQKARETQEKDPEFVNLETDEHVYATHVLQQV